MAIEEGVLGDRLAAGIGFLVAREGAEIADDGGDVLKGLDDDGGWQGRGDGDVDVELALDSHGILV